MNILTKGYRTGGDRLFANRSADFLIRLFDINGRLVLDQRLGTIEGGLHEYTLIVGNLSSGVYFYELKADGLQTRKKVVLIR